MNLYHQAVINVLKQGGPSVEQTLTHKNCLYRAPNGRKCAAGHLIADEDYRPDMEGSTAGSQHVWPTLAKHNLDMGKVFSLQRWHDDGPLNLEGEAWVTDRLDNLPHWIDRKVIEENL